MYRELTQNNIKVSNTQLQINSYFLISPPKEKGYQFSVLAFWSIECVNARHLQTIACLLCIALFNLPPRLCFHSTICALYVVVTVLAYRHFVQQISRKLSFNYCTDNQTLTTLESRPNWVNLGAAELFALPTQQPWSNFPSCGSTVLCTRKVFGILNSKNANLRSHLTNHQITCPRQPMQHTMLQRRPTYAVWLQRRLR